MKLNMCLEQLLAPLAIAITGAIIILAICLAPKPKTVVKYVPAVKSHIVCEVFINPNTRKIVGKPRCHSLNESKKQGSNHHSQSRYEGYSTWQKQLSRSV